MSSEGIKNAVQDFFIIFFKNNRTPGRRNPFSLLPGMFNTQVEYIIMPSFRISAVHSGNTIQIITADRKRLSGSHNTPWYIVSELSGNKEY